MKIKTTLIFLGLKFLKQENKLNTKQSKQDKNKVKRLRVWDSHCCSSKVPGNGARKLVDGLVDGTECFLPGNGARKLLDGGYWKALEELGGAPNEGEPRFIEPVGLWNQQWGECWRSLALNLQQTWTCTHLTKYFVHNGGKVVNLSGLAENKAVNCMMK